MDQAKNNLTTQNSQKIFCKQPISCPWITSQPYQSTLNKNRACESSLNKSLPSIPLSMESRTVNEKTCPSLQHSSSQFFYFLRLMQLFPETHPATLHTVLNLCKNDFFCAVDKLLYAKRCKALYSRSQSMFKRCSSNRSHPYCTGHGAVKNLGQQEKVRNGEVESSSKDSANEKVSGASKMKIIVDDNEDGVKEDNDIPSNLSLENESQTSKTTNAVPCSFQETEKIVEDLSPNSMTQESKGANRLL